MMLSCLLISVLLSLNIDVVYAWTLGNANGRSDSLIASRSWKHQSTESFAIKLSAPSIRSDQSIELSTQSSKNTTILSAPEKSNPQSQSSEFYVRPALMIDMGPASKILADGFYKSKVNFFQYHFERLQTFLSLETTFPQPNTKHEIFVACCMKSGTVWGMVEVDARNDGTDRKYRRSSSPSTMPSGTDEVTGPYMCNLAVDDRYQRKGIATALVLECERQVKEWHMQVKQKHSEQLLEDEDSTAISNDNISSLTATAANTTVSPNTISNSLLLKVRESNKAAVTLYSNLGYQSVWQETEDKTGETVLLMRKQLSCTSTQDSCTPRKLPIRSSE